MQPTSIGLLEQTLVEEQAGQVAGCTQETLAEELEVMIARSMTTSVALAPTSAEVGGVLSSTTEPSSLNIGYLNQDMVRLVTYQMQHRVMPFEQGAGPSSIHRNTYRRLPPVLQNEYWLCHGCMIASKMSERCPSCHADGLRDAMAVICTYLDDPG